MTQRVDIQLLGMHYVIPTDDVEQLQQSVNMVNKHIENIQSTGSAIDSTRLLALVALNLASELISQQAVEQQTQKDLNSELERLASLLEGLAKVPLR